MRQATSSSSMHINGNEVAVKATLYRICVWTTITADGVEFSICHKLDAAAIRQFGSALHGAAAQLLVIADEIEGIETNDATVPPCHSCNRVDMEDYLAQEGQEYATLKAKLAEAKAQLSDALAGAIAQPEAQPAPTPADAAQAAHAAPPLPQPTQCAWLERIARGEVPLADMGIGDAHLDAREHDLSDPASRDLDRAPHPSTPHCLDCAQMTALNPHCRLGYDSIDECCRMRTPTPGATTGDEDTAYTTRPVWVCGDCAHYRYQDRKSVV